MHLLDVRRVRLFQQQEMFVAGANSVYLLLFSLFGAVFGRGLTMSAQKVVVIGAGAVGLNYGLRLLESELKPVDISQRSTNHQTHLLVRSDYDGLCSHGCVLSVEDQEPVIFSPEELRPRVYQDHAELIQNIGLMDIVVISVKAYSLDEGVRSMIKALSHENTRFLVIMNGIGIEDNFATFLPQDKIFGSVSMIGCNRVYREGFPLLVRNFKEHILNVGHYQDNQDELTSLLGSLWKDTQIAGRVSAVPSLLAARWSKLCWNIAFSGLSVALGGVTVDVIYEDPSLHDLADRIMDDVIRIADVDLRHQHNTLRPGQAYTDHFPNREAWKELMWRGTKELGPYKPSTMIDLIENKEMEVEYIFSKPLERARKLKELYPDLYFGNLESVVLAVEGMWRMQKKKRIEGVAWDPVWVK